MGDKKKCNLPSNRKKINKWVHTKHKNFFGRMGNVLKNYMIHSNAGQ